MDADIIRNMTDHLHHYTVTFSGNYARPREPSINSHHALGVAQPGDIFQFYLSEYYN